MKNYADYMKKTILKFKVKKKDKRAVVCVQVYFLWSNQNLLIVLHAITYDGQTSNRDDKK